MRLLMNDSDILNYAAQIGGKYAQDNIQAIPYNHWKQDCEWLVLVLDPDSVSMFIPVCARDAEKAVDIAIKRFRFFRD